MIILVALIYLAGLALYWSRWADLARIGVPLDRKLTVIVALLWPVALVYEELL